MYAAHGLGEHCSARSTLLRRGWKPNAYTGTRAVALGTGVESPRVIGTRHREDRVRTLNVGGVRRRGRAYWCSARKFDYCIWSRTLSDPFAVKMRLQIMRPSPNIVCLLLGGNPQITPRARKGHASLPACQKENPASKRRDFRRSSVSGTTQDHTTTARLACNARCARSRTNYRRVILYRSTQKQRAPVPNQRVRGLFCRPGY